jgi:hypothetical protein
MEDGNRCGKRCNGSTLKNAIIYFPPGTYRIAYPIPIPFGTQVIGDVSHFFNIDQTGLISKTNIYASSRQINGRLWLLPVRSLGLASC